MMKQVKYFGLALCAFSLFLVAGEPAKTETKTAGGGGMVIEIDPARGTIKENPQLSDAMQEELARLVNTSSEGLTETTLRNGTVVVDLQGRFQSAVVATIDKDGNVHSSCVSSEPGHDHKVHGPDESKKK